MEMSHAGPLHSFISIGSSPRGEGDVLHDSTRQLLYEIEEDSPSPPPNSIFDQEEVVDNSFDEEQDVRLEFLDEQDEPLDMSFVNTERRLSYKKLESPLRTTEFAKVELRYKTEATPIKSESHSVKLESPPDRAEQLFMRERTLRHGYSSPVLKSEMIKSEMKDFTFTRSVRRKTSSRSPLSSPVSSFFPNTATRNSLIHRSPPHPPITSLRTPISITPPELRSSSESFESEGSGSGGSNSNNNRTSTSFMREVSNESLSLERNVSSLNIASANSTMDNNTKKRDSYTPLKRKKDEFVIPRAPPLNRINSQQQQYVNGHKNRVEPLAGPHMPREQELIVINHMEYIVLKWIGEGGSGKVFQIMQRTEGETCGQIFALKWIYLRRTEDGATTINEIELLKSLKNQNGIIGLVDYLITSQTIYMVMELGEVDLDRMLRVQIEKPWDPNFIRHYWHQMLQAVHVIHQHNIVHTDLKPANFVLVKGWLKLIDFGIANRVSDDTTNIHRDNQLGTLSYMSPEALIDVNGGTEDGRLIKLGTSSDVWSLGCILYQMVYGKPPFFHLNHQQRYLHIPNPNYKIPFPSRVRYNDFSTEVEIPVMLIQLLKGCLDRNPKARPPLVELLRHPFVFL